MPSKCSIAYFRLPRTSAPRPLPATRTTKSSFGPSLKTSSIGTRASEQPSTAANGRLLWHTGAIRYRSQIPQIDRNDSLDTGLVVVVIEKRGEISIAVIQPEQR